MIDEEKIFYKSLKPYLILFLTIILYISLIFLYKKVGNEVLMLSVIPPVLLAFFYGIWAGLIFETVMIFTIAALITYFIDKGINKNLFYTLQQGAGGMIGHYVLICLIGYLHHQHVKIKKLNIEIIRISRIDELTALFNRRALLEIANREFALTLRNISDISYYYNLDSDDKSVCNKKNENIDFKKKRYLNDYVGVFTIALFDIDDFKKVNDSFGHLVGDDVLKKIGDIMKEPEILRKYDVCGRYGGEEFFLLFPCTSSRNAVCVVKRIANRIKKNEFIASNNTNFKVTISVGLSQYNKEDNDLTDILKRVDKALYYAKNHGKDKIVVFEDSSLNKNDNNNNI